MRLDYKARRIKFCQAMGIEYKDFENRVVEMYEKEKKSASQVAEYLSKIGKEKITTRSIQRLLRKNGVIRDAGDAFRLAAKQGRVKWHYVENATRRNYHELYLTRKIRFKLLKRDGFKCVLCGHTAVESPLEVDHIVPKVRGGQTRMENCRILCLWCNKGKQQEDHEYSTLGDA